MVSALADAKWIWTDENPDLPNRWVWFRRTFHVKSADDAARIHCCADTRYRLWVNGNLVGFGPVKYHLPTPTYDTYDLKPFLKVGGNIVCFLVHSVGNAGTGFGSFMSRRGSLIAAVEIGADRIVSDRSWKAIRDRGYAEDTPRQSGHQSFVECFDAGASLGAPWVEPCDDAKWPQAVELSGEVFPPWEKLEPRDIPHLTAEPTWPLRIHETGIAVPAKDLNPLDMKTQAQMLSSAQHRPAGKDAASVCPQPPGAQSVVTLCGDTMRAREGVCPPINAPAPAAAPCSDAGIVSPAAQGAYAVWDFGKIISGYVFVEVAGTPGAIVDLGYSEALTDGRVDCYKQGIRYADRVILPKGERTVTHCVMMPKTLRYLHVEVRRGKATVRRAGVLMSTYPVERTGSFVSSDGVLDSVWEMGAHTVQLCMEDSYVDTPWRERSAWLGDIVIESRVNYSAFGDVPLIRRFLDQVMRGQQPDGKLSGKYPSGNYTWIPTWSLTYAFAMADYLMYTGDADLARRMWPGVERIRGWFDKWVGPTGLLENLSQKPWRDYVLIDWSPIDHRGAIGALNAHYVQFLRDGAWLAEQVGHANDARDWRSRADAVAKAYRQHLWDPERGIFVNNICDGVRSRRAGQHENLLAILNGIATPEQQASIERRILSEHPLPIFEAPGQQFDMVDNKYPWDDAKLVAAGSPYFSYYVVRALFDMGRTQDALDYIRRHWGGMAARGATSTWENWHPDTGSLSHGWSAGPTSLLHEFVLGIAPTSPGFSTFDVLPSPGDLTSAKGRMPSPLGVIEAAWERGNGGWRIRVTVPNGATARVGVLAAEATSISVDGAPARTEEVELQRGKYLASILGAGLHEVFAK